LHIGDEKDEPIKAAQAARRRPERRLAPVRLWTRRRRGLVRAPAALVSTVAKAA